MLPNRKEIATGRWPAILRGLGIDAKFLNRKHGPCPMCGGNDRFRFTDYRQHGDWICNQCGHGDGYAMLQAVNGWTFGEAAKQVEQFLGVTHVRPETPQVVDLEARNLARIREVWAECVPVEFGDPVWRYLDRRQILPAKIPNCLRHHPALFYKDDAGSDYYPAMVAAVTDSDGRGVTLHRTYLTEVGTKAPVGSSKKLMPGRIGNGSIKLAKPSSTLGVAEGIETALAAMRRFGVPVWSCLNATLLEQWNPPEGVSTVHVYADNDSSFTGQAAAFGLANRLRRAGIDVTVHVPEKPDTDYADYET